MFLNLVSSDVCKQCCMHEPSYLALHEGCPVQRGRRLELLFLLSISACSNSLLNFSSWSESCFCKVRVYLADRVSKDNPRGPKRCKCQAGFIRGVMADSAAAGKARLL